MPTENAYYSGQLVLSDFGTCICSDDNNFFKTCIACELFSFNCPLVLLFYFVLQHFWLRYSRTALLLWLYILNFDFTLYRVFSNYLNISLIKHVKDWLTRNLISLTHFCISKPRTRKCRGVFIMRNTYLMSQTDLLSDYNWIWGLYLHVWYYIHPMSAMHTESHVSYFFEDTRDGKWKSYQPDPLKR